MIKYDTYTVMNDENIAENKNKMNSDMTTYQIEAMFSLLGNTEILTLINRKGIVIKVSDYYMRQYGKQALNLLGESVFDLEKRGIIVPSVGALVLHNKCKMTALQRLNNKQSVLTSGIPITNYNGEVEYVICIDAVDIIDTENLRMQFESIRDYIASTKPFAYSNSKTHMNINESESIKSINKLIYKIADTDATVLITGETGTGKSTIAQFIHEISSRSKGPFIEINCGAIPPTLIESELFGYEKGAFTGANQNGKIGKIELANGGTLFLDEIGELPLPDQKKLLEIIQTKNIIRVGGVNKINVDFRLIAATNIDLKNAVRNGKFREDLFYRLFVVPIHIPPLRERREDIVPICLFFLDVFNKKYNRSISFSKKALNQLQKKQWPGNIRQIENLIERLVITASDNVIKSDSLPEDISEELYNASESTPTNSGTLSELLDAYEEKIIKNTMKKCKNSNEVGIVLGISQSTAARKIRKYFHEDIPF